MAPRIVSSALPADFTSLYRLFLRSSAASVLNQRIATHRLRALWRPTFESAAQVIHRLQSEKLTRSEANNLEQWYGVWQQRMDNTLSLFYVSAMSRGLPHQLTRNLARLVTAYHHYISVSGTTSRKYWNGQLPDDSEAYKRPTVRVGSRLDNRGEKRARWTQTDNHAWDAFGEVIMMAEGKHRISLGRIRKKDRLHNLAVLRV